MRIKDIRRLMESVESGLADEPLLERLPQNFADAAYGYWITPEGEFINVEQRNGHIDTLIQHPDFDYIGPSTPSEEIYNDALEMGWVRVVAPNNSFREMAFQFMDLGPATRRALLNLITDLMDYDVYIFETNPHKRFDNKKDAYRFVRHFEGHNAQVSMESWNLSRSKQ